MRLDLDVQRDGFVASWFENQCIRIGSPRASVSCCCRELELSLVWKDTVCFFETFASLNPWVNFQFVPAWSCHERAESYHFVGETLR